jgi:hypothetical protein
LPPLVCHTNVQQAVEPFEFGFSAVLGELQETLRRLGEKALVELALKTACSELQTVAILRGREGPK